MRRSAADALVALVLGLAGCTFDDGHPWGEAEVGLRASFEVPASRLRADGSVKTARDYAVKLDVLKLTFSTLTIGMSEGEGDTPAGFDPAAPPEGFSLCHNGHCHGADGKLYSYAEVAAAAAGGGESAGGAAPVVTVDVGTEDGVALAETPVDVPLAGCPCDLPRGTFTAAQLTVTRLQVRGSVTDLRPTSRLATPVVQVDLDLPLDAVFSAPLEGGVTRGDFGDQQLAFAATLVLTPKVLDAIDFSLSTPPAELSQTLSETVRTDSVFEVEITR
jgi:hypothetical protein